MEENNLQQRAEVKDNGVTLLDLWQILAKYFWRILILTVACTLVEIFVVRSVVKTQYTAKASIIMNPGLMESNVVDVDEEIDAIANTSTANMTGTYYALSIRLVPSISKFIKTSKRLVDDVKDKAKDQQANPNVEPLTNGSVSVETSEDELQLFVSYTTQTSAEAAVATVRAIVESACEVSKAKDNGQYIYLWANTLHVDDVPKSASASNRWMTYTIIAAVLFFVLFYAYYLIATLLDDTIKSKHEIEDMTGFNVMAYIDDIDPEKMKKSSSSAGKKPLPEKSGS